MKRRTTMLKKLPLATAIALSFAATGQAADFEVGDYEIKFDSLFCPTVRHGVWKIRPTT